MSDDALRWEDYPEYDEADYPEAPNVRRFQRRTPPPRQYTPPPAPAGYATKKELTDALVKVREDIAAIGRRIDDVGQRTSRQLSEQAKKNDARFGQVQQLGVMSAVLGRPDSKTLDAASAGTVGLNAGDKIFVERSGKSSSLLPVLLLSGGFGSSDGSCGDNSGMMLAALALSGQL